MVVTGTCEAPLCDGDRHAWEAAAAVPFISTITGWWYRDVLAWPTLHNYAVYVDATSDCISIVRPGRAPVSFRLSSALPIYLSQYVAALLAIFLMSRSKLLCLYTDNMGVCANLNKGRCSRAGCRYHWTFAILGAFLCAISRLIVTRPTPLLGPPGGDLAR